MAFLADAGLTGWIGATGSIIAAILSVTIYFLTRKKKALSYEVLSEYPLISIDDEIKGKLQILYGGNPVENVHLLLVKFINNGNIPIIASDFERHLTLRLKGESNVLSAVRVKASPDNLTASLEIKDKVITVAPALMNGGDFFTVKVLIGQYGGSFDVDARIVGVKSIRVVRRQAQTEWMHREWRVAFIGGLSAILMMALVLSFFAFFRGNRNHAEEESPPQQAATSITPSPTVAAIAPTATPESTPYETSVPNSSSIVIPEIGKATPYPSEINVSGVTGTLTKLMVEIVDVSHSYANDLDILVVGPNGKGVILMAGVGGSKDFGHTNIVFDDDATLTALFKGDMLNANITVPRSSTIASGTYRPTSYKKTYGFTPLSNVMVYNKLSVFDGINPNGRWGLYIIDNSPSDGGMINGGWKLKMTIDPIPPPSPTPAPSQTPPPGQP
jgi:subtilisin-like proprotein convertase family protein